MPDAAADPRRVDEWKVMSMARYAWFVLLALMLTGCAGYGLRGRVVEGPVSAVHIVPADDPRLAEPPITGASVHLTVDADRLSAKPAGAGHSDADGDFHVPVDAFGAGFLEHDVEVLVRAQGHAPAQRVIRLPGRDRRVLVTLAPGEDAVSPRPGQLLDETLRMSEPYMGR